MFNMILFLTVICDNYKKEFKILLYLQKFY